MKSIENLKINNKQTLSLGDVKETENKSLQQNR